MALEYGYGLYQSDPATRAHWKKKFDALDEFSRKFFHETLPYMLLFSDVGVVSYNSILHITRRLEYWHAEVYRQVIKALAEYDEKLSMELFLQRYIGYRANIVTLSTREYIKRAAQQLRDRLPKITDPEAETEDRMSDAILLDDLQPDELPLYVNKKWYPEFIAQEYQRRLALAT